MDFFLIFFKRYNSVTNVVVDAFTTKETFTFTGLLDANQTLVFGVFFASSVGIHFYLANLKMLK